jgi:hypothetical protein
VAQFLLPGTKTRVCHGGHRPPLSGPTGSCHAGSFTSGLHGSTVRPRQAGYFRSCRAWPTGLGVKSRHGPE